MQIKFGSVVVDGAGKLGGHQIQGGRMAPSLVTKRSSNRKTQRQMTWQNRQVAKLSAVWRRMSSEEQAVWDYHPKGKFRFLSKYEGSKELSGYSAFLRYNLLTSRSGAPVIKDWRVVDASTTQEWWPVEDLIFQSIGLLGINLYPRGDVPPPLIYIASWSDGQSEPKPSQAHAIVDFDHFTPTHHPLWRPDSNPWLKSVAKDDYLVLWRREFKDGFPQSFTAPAKRSVASQSFFQ